MTLLTGPSGSGKTRRILARLRESIQSHANDVLVLVPTATLTSHLRHLLARDGLVFRPESIRTLTRFARDRTPDFREVSPPLFLALTGEAVRAANRPEFSGVMTMPGLHSLLANTMQQFENAGGTPDQLSWALARTRETPQFAQAFLDIWRRTNALVEEHGLVTRAGLLRRAAVAVRKEGMGAFRVLCLDGFGALSELELQLVRALGQHCEVLATLPDAAQSPSIGAARDALLAAGFREEKLARDREPADQQVFTARDLQREADEIARRILAAYANGMPFRRMGVVLRTPDVYRPVLETTFERFGIPCRGYFQDRLRVHPAAQFYLGIVAAWRSGWDFEQTVGALRWAPSLGTSAALDHLERVARDKYPGRGLEALASFTQYPPPILGELSKLETFRGRQRTAAQWAEAAGALRNLFRPGDVRDQTDFAQLAIWRSQADALRLLDAVLAEAAEVFGAEQRVAFEDYWAAVETMLDSAPLRVRDDRRDVVHLISAFEARQWDLDLLFVCGLIEKQFPRKHPQNMFFRDSMLREIAALGLNVRTAEDLDREEAFLFESALGAARREVVLSYPRLDARGDEQLISRFLQSVPRESETCPAVRPAIAPQPRFAPAPMVRHGDLLRVLAERPKFSASSLENFLKCPYKYFSDKTLRLRPLPVEPHERLNFLVRGNIAHQTLEKFARGEGSLEQVFEPTFAENCAQNNVIPSYETELLKHQIFQALAAAVGSELWPSSRIEPETSFSIALADGTLLDGRMDATIERPDGSVTIYDYKYGKNAKRYVDSEATLQAPIYVYAAEQSGRAVHSVFYIALREGEALSARGWSREPGKNTKVVLLTDEWLRERMDVVLRSIEEIRAGRIHPAPLNGECKYCDFTAICRYEAAEAMAAGE